MLSLAQFFLAFGISLSFSQSWFSRCVYVRIINPQWDKIYVVQYREASNKNFENTRDLCGCLWQKMERESETISIVIENLMFQKWQQQQKSC